MMIYAVLSHFDFVVKFTVKNLNKDFINTIWGGGGNHFVKVFHKKGFFKGWLPLASVASTLGSWSGPSLDHRDL